MAKKITNPQYPHQCRIYRMEGITSFNPEGKIKVIYEDVCRKSTSTNIRTFNTGNNNTGKVDVADYRISVPGIVEGLQKGDLVDVTDLIGTEKGMRVVMYGATQMGEYKKTDEDGKTEIIRGGTELLCNLPSN